MTMRFDAPSLAGSQMSYSKVTKLEDVREMLRSTPEVLDLIEGGKLFCL